jgi:phenylacetate-coenzyme A ligase PaaK-like adenylate-forming protein
MEPILAAFRRAAKLPFYKAILARKKVKVAAVKTVADFDRLVPILKKEDYSFLQMAV